MEKIINWGMVRTGATIVAAEPHFRGASVAHYNARSSRLSLPVAWRGGAKSAVVKRPTVDALARAELTGAVVLIVELSDAYYAADAAPWGARAIHASQGFVTLPKNELGSKSLDFELVNRDGNVLTLMAK